MLANMERLTAPLKRAARMAAALALAVTCLTVAARANDLADFTAAVETAMSHHRVASGYLRTGNVDLAVLELEGMREAWAKVTSLPRPAAFRDTQRYSATMLDIATRIVGVFLVLDLGRIDVARDSLDAMRTSLSALRRAGGVMVLADCVLDANVAMDALFGMDGRAPDPDVAAKAEAYGATLQRCDGIAPAGIRAEAQFRRLIDGALASLAQVSKAVETRDGDLLQRLLIELRAFDHLLAFRYG
jgi:hypothetical protein